MRTRALLVIIVVSMLVLPGLAALPAPSVDRNQVPSTLPKPSGDGPYSVGWVTDQVATTTKNYTVGVKIYYPATSMGSDAAADTSSAPYPTIVWLPGFGGNEGHYGSLLQTMSSWGLVVMAVGVNWTDWPFSANTTDMEDFLDYLENENVTPTSRLHSMVDKQAFGLSGHSSGGGLTVVNSAYVDRIKAAQPLAAAIGAGAVDAIGPLYNGKPILFQVGKDDSTYIAGSRRGYEKIGPPNTLVEIIGAGHGGPYATSLLVAFYLYHLDGESGYMSYIYGDGLIQDHLNNTFDVWFKLSDTYYFPPTVDASVLNPSVNMDERVDFIGNISGYYPASHPQQEFVWDFDNDGTDDHTHATEPNTSHFYDMPGNMQVMFKYKLGRLEVPLAAPLQVMVQNIAPTAVAGEDVSLMEDEVHTFDASSSFDTPSDNATLLFEWDFGDGSKRTLDTDPMASHSYSDEGTYMAKVTVKDGHGSSSIDDLEVTVTNAGPSADAGGDISSFEDEEVLFTGTGNDTASDVAGLEFMWDFGDGEGTDWSDLSTATHVYDAQDNYTATLSVRDDDGAVTTDTVLVIVSNVAPNGGITLPETGTEVNEDDEVEFFGWGDDSLSDTDGLEFMWDFGDGGSTSWGPGPTTIHTYLEAGEYIATFTIRDDDGDGAVYSVMVVVNNLAPTAEIVKPAADLSIKEDEVVKFIGDGEDTPTDMELLSYTWTVESTTYEGKEMDHTFTSSGTFEATFTVTDPDGESAVQKVTVTVSNPRPTVTASLKSTKLDEGGTLEFSATVSDNPSDSEGLKVEWDFGDGTTSTDLDGNHTYPTAGTYTVKVTVTDDDGAKAEQTFTVTVVEPKTPPKPKKTNGDSGNDLMMIGGLGALALIIVVVLVALMLMRRRGSGETSAQGPPPIEEQEYPEDEPHPREDEMDREEGPPEEELEDDKGPGPEPEEDGDPEPGQEPEGEMEPEPEPEEGAVDEKGPEMGPEPEEVEEPGSEEVVEKGSGPGTEGKDDGLDDILASIKGLQKK